MPDTWAVDSIKSRDAKKECPAKGILRSFRLTNVPCKAAILFMLMAKKLVEF
jgi:hypothetical protein